MNTTTGLVIAGTGLAATLVGGLLQVTVLAEPPKLVQVPKAEFVEPRRSVEVSPTPLMSNAALINMSCQQEDTCDIKLDYHDHGWYATITTDRGETETYRLTK